MILRNALTTFFFETRLATVFERLPCNSGQGISFLIGATHRLKICVNGRLPTAGGQASTLYQKDRIVSMKKTYSLYAVGIALILASGVLLTHPPITALAIAYCETTCSNGKKIKVSGVSCFCNEVGCSATDANGKTTVTTCPTPGEEEFVVPEEGPIN